jgi:hypothetical protein
MPAFWLFAILGVVALRLRFAILPATFIERTARYATRHAFRISIAYKRLHVGGRLFILNVF